MTSHTSTSIPLAVLRCPDKFFANCWKARDPQRSELPGELIALDRITAGNTRKIKQVRMGLPRLQFIQSNTTPMLALEQRALAEEEVVLLTELGAGVPWLNCIRKINFPTDRVLLIKIPDHKIIYKTLPGRELTVAWGEGADYTYSGNDTDKRLLSAHYEARKIVVLYQLPRAPLNQYLQDVVLKHTPSEEFYLDYAIISPSTADLDCFESHMQGIAPIADICDDLLSLVTQGFAFPETLRETPPLDVDWLPWLLVPPGTAAYEHPHYIKILGLSSFHYTPSITVSAAPQGALVSDAPSVSPLISVVGSGYEKQPLEIFASGPVQVNFRGEHAGKIDKVGDIYYYVPPANLQPAIRYESGGKTTQSPALLESLTKRADADVVQVSANGETASSMFVTLYARQTHYIKLSLVNSTMKLELWYFDAGQGRAMQVPQAETEWSIITGNGSLDSAGIFFSAPQPTPFTVIAGRDLGNPRLLYWAVTTIAVPLYTPAQFVAFFDD